MAVLRLVSDYTKLKKLQREGEQSVPHSEDRNAVTSLNCVQM